MRTYVASGHNITNTAEMKKALDAHSGVAGCQVAVVQIDRSKQTLKKHKWKGVNAITNLHFTEAGIMIYKAFGIGAGKLITNEELDSYSSIKQTQGSIGVELGFTKPKQAHGMISKPMKQIGEEPLKNAEEQPQRMEELPEQMDEPAGFMEQLHDITDELPEIIEEPQEVAEELPDNSNSNNFVFCCPELGCTRKFLTFRGMEKHVLVGKHKLALQKESTYDKIKVKWCDHCNNINTTLVCERECLQNTRASHQTHLHKGWALKKEKSNKRLDHKVKEYLVECYNKGEQTEQKASAKDVAETMKYKKDSAGKPVFAPSQWLQPSQVTSFFSRQTCLVCLKSTTSVAFIKKQEKKLDDDDDDDDLNVVAEATDAETIRNHIHSVL